MTEPQVWTIIGVLATGLFGLLTLMSTMFARIIRVEVGSIRTELSIRFDSVNRRIDGLDRDIHFLMNRDVEK